MSKAKAKAAGKSKPLPLRVSRMNFYRLHGDDFFEWLMREVQATFADGKDLDRKWDALSPLQQGVYTWWYFYTEVQNGGLAQYFYNQEDGFLPALAKLLKASDNTPLAEMLTPAAKIYRKHKAKFAVENPFGEDGLFTSMTELAALDRPLCRQLNKTSKSLEKWLRANFDQLAVGDDGEPLDPKFSGQLETQHPNGKVHERATINRGAFNGPYHRFFDDGQLEFSCFYKAGEVSTDYWPSGQPKFKEMKRGKLTVKEWYHESGNIQKRYVTDKTGFAIEPIQVWYDNGQLAEEIHKKQGDKVGPCLKFFDDGSPRLEAVYQKGELLVVKNAWNDQRQQTVKDGTGTYYDDGIDFDPSWKLFHAGSWSHSQELVDGARHGVETTWNDGVLWRTCPFVNGKPHGESTLYYDNGRVRTKTWFESGKEVKEQEFPKFDNPRPVVLIQVEANEKLFRAWKHPLLDVYPQVKNLADVQKRLPMPEFLAKLFEKNKAGSVTNNYEDWSTFEDGVAYMVWVNEKGAVDSIDFSGASMYSGCTIETYPPFLQKLKFEPGRIGKRKVRCRVLVRVEHTFVEEAKS